MVARFVKWADSPQTTKNSELIRALFLLQKIKSDHKPLQKLAIARALYKDSPIVILDEPTAALDPRAEYEIYTRFLALVESKTSIFISHRLSSTKFCDRIVLFKDGSIEETGTHNELLQKGGLYAELFRMQAQFYFDN